MQQMKVEQEKWDKTMTMEGTENAYLLHKELGEWMTDNVTVVRYNDRLEETIRKFKNYLNDMKILISMIRNNGLTKVHHLHVN